MGRLAKAGFVLAVLGLVFTAGWCDAQTVGASVQGPAAVTGQGVVTGKADGESAERQRQLVADADRLLKLALELKADVDKTNKDVLSLEVVRKADEIEHLAHSVQTKVGK